MKKMYSQKLNKNLVPIASILLGVLLFSGCKKNDEEVNSSFLESKLSGNNSQQWYAPFYLSGDACISFPNPATILFHSNNTFDYSHGSCTSSGSWSMSYAANRSGQAIELNLYYMAGTVQYNETISLKYSSDQDILYALDPEKIKLYPFEKYTLLP